MSTFENAQEIAAKRNNLTTEEYYNQVTGFAALVAGILKPKEKTEKATPVVPDMKHTNVVDSN